MYVIKYNERIKYNVQCRNKLTTELNCEMNCNLLNFTSGRINFRIFNMAIKNSDVFLI